MKHLFTFLTIAGILAAVQAQTIIPPGDVSGNWNQAGSPYQITGDITIPNNETLTIDQGVTVEFQGHYSLLVQGKVIAIGSPTDSIFFTVNDTTGFHIPDAADGGWNGIRFLYTPAENDSSKFLFCKFSFSKAIGLNWPDHNGGAICIVDFDKVLLVNCRFEHNSATGTDSPSGGALHLTDADIKLVGNVFSNCHAWDGGAIQIYNASPVFINNVITNNFAEMGGGGIWIGGESNPSFSGDEISQNYSVQNGGGLMSWQGTETSFSNVLFSGNTSIWGAGAGFIDCDVHMNGCSFIENIADGIGGGIATDYAYLKLENTIFQSDSSSGLSGAVHSWFSDIEASHCEFYENSAVNGGAIYADFSQVEVDTCYFIGNTANSGGAIDAFDCNLSIDSCVFNGNSGISDAGAINCGADSLIFDSEYVVEILNSIIINNSAYAAGGISIQQMHTDEPLIDLVIDNCEITGNRAHHVGGFRIMRCTYGVQVSNSIVGGNTAEAWTGGGSINNGTIGEVYNCIFSANQAATVNNGATTGGLGVATGANISIMNNTFVNNSAGVGGGLQAYRGGQAIATNNIFWGNMPDQIGLSAVVDSLPCLVTLNHNDIQYGQDSIKINDTVSTVNWGVGNIDVDPQFENPAYYDFQLLNSSPAIGAAIDSIEIEGEWYYCPMFDLNGNPRPGPAGSMPDMGAYENPNGEPVGFFENLRSGQNGIHSGNYPNPFSRATTIEINLPENSQVTIRIYNMLGTELATIISSELCSGIHHFKWKPDQSESGFYFYRIDAETKSGKILSDTKRMLFLR